MCQRPRKSGPQRYRKYTSCHSVCVLCMASSYKYDCSEVYISKKIKLLWKTKFAMASDSKFYSHCEANHSIIRRYDHSLVRQYGRQICLLHKFNKLFEYRRHRTLLKSKLTRSLVTAFQSPCIVDCENEFVLTLFLSFIFHPNLVSRSFLHLPSSVVL